MFDPLVVQALWTTFLYSLGGSVLAMIIRMLNRKSDGPSLSQSAAVGALIGAGFGALFAIFGSMLNRL